MSDEQENMENPVSNENVPETSDNQNIDAEQAPPVPVEVDTAAIPTLTGSANIIKDWPSEEFGHQYQVGSHMPTHALAYHSSSREEDEKGSILRMEVLRNQKLLLVVERHHRFNSKNQNSDPPFNVLTRIRHVLEPSDLCWIPPPTLIEAAQKSLKR